MAATLSLNPFSILAESWAFVRKQPVLLHVLLWMLVLPVVLLDILEWSWPEAETETLEGISQLGFALAGLLLLVVTVWGTASILLIGRRLIVSRAGRTRTSFSSVRRESARLILPLFFTDVLRGIITLYWAMIPIGAIVAFFMYSQSCSLATIPTLIRAGTAPTASEWEAALRGLFPACGGVVLPALLFILPVLYQIRTAFYGPVLASENLRYRDALHRSRDVVAGNVLRVIGALLVLTLLLVLPVALLSFALFTLEELAPASFPYAQVIADAFEAFAGLLFTLCLVSIFARLRKAKKGPQQVLPDLQAG